MSTRIYIRTKEHNRKISEALQGRFISAETRELISIRTREAMADPTIRKKLSLAKKGHVPWTKDKKMSEEFCRKVSLGHKGQKPWNTGKHWSSEHRRILSIAHGGNGIPQRKYPLEFNDKLKQPVFSRDGYKCQICGSKCRLVCHHKDEDKKNNQMSNLQTLCKACHIKIHGIAGWNKKKEI